jgi:hypothetical protein
MSKTTEMLIYEMALRVRLYLTSQKPGKKYCGKYGKPRQLPSIQ